MFLLFLSSKEFMALFYQTSMLLHSTKKWLMLHLKAQWAE